MRRRNAGSTPCPRVQRCTRRLVWGLRFTLVAGALHGVQAQVPAAQEAAGPDAPVRFVFTARPGVCGHDGDGWIVRESDGRTRVSSRGGIRIDAHAGGPACENEPVYVDLSRSAGGITSAHVRVGADAVRNAWPRIRPEDAAAFLLEEARLGRAAPRAAREMVFAAALADTQTWPRLLQLAQSRSVADEPRKAAMFWLGQAAGDEAVRGLVSVAGDGSSDLEVREAAVFSLSRMQGEEALDALIGIARTHSEPRIRRSAMFWLAQGGTPRALAFFEEVLRGGH